MMMLPGDNSCAGPRALRGRDKGGVRVKGTGGIGRGGGRPSASWRRVSSRLVRVHISEGGGKVIAG